MLERAVSLKADDYRAWGFLATVYAYTRVSRTKVEETYRKAIARAEGLRKHSPDDGYLLADLAGYYAAVGMARQSESFLQQAAARSSGAPEVLYQVAAGFEMLHQRDQALTYIDRAIAAGTSVQFLERVPQLSALRADSRYRAVLSHVRLDHAERGLHANDHNPATTN